MGDGCHNCADSGTRVVQNRITVERLRKANPELVPDDLLLTAMKGPAELIQALEDRAPEGEHVMGAFHLVLPHIYTMGFSEEEAKRIDEMGDEPG